MKIIYNRWIPFGQFDAINLFGHLFVRNGVDLSPILVNHERIHSAQQREWLWLPFFALYLLEWLWQMIRFKGNWLKAYRAISFEREAYTSQNDLDYVTHRRPFANYRKSKSN